MTGLLFGLLIVTLFWLLQVYEAAGDERQLKLQPTGLFSWLISDNWPAKVGACLLLVGVGALLRYAFAHIDVLPSVKLGGGVVIAALLGMVAHWFKPQPERRALYLALAGAAFGVLYLTAYSAYGFFNYLNDFNALALLFLVSVAAGYFAVSHRVMSVAILAMVGAYLAPRFAIGTPTVLGVYGYYLLASLGSLLLVALRGWRPLIHLSFLFTLAGALFFGWDQQFYRAEFYPQMLPLLLALTAVHLLMPQLETRANNGSTLQRFDTLYNYLLPVVAAGLTLKIAPELSRDGAYGLFSLAGLWAVAAIGLAALKREGAYFHLLIACLMSCGGLFLLVADLPWLLLLLTVSVVLLAAAPRLGWSHENTFYLATVTMLLAAFEIISSLLDKPQASIFFNQLLAERLYVAGLLLVAAQLLRTSQTQLSRLLLLLGAGWAGLSLLIELQRFDFDYWALSAYLLLLIGLMISNVRPKQTWSAYVEVTALFGLLLLAKPTADSVAFWAVPLLMLMVSAVLLSLVRSYRELAEDDDFSPALSLGLLPLVLLPWAFSLESHWALKSELLVLLVVMLAIAAAGLAARVWLSASQRWQRYIQPLHVYAVAIALLLVTLSHIERHWVGVLFELSALAYLLVYILRHLRQNTELPAGVVMLFALALLLACQAMLLRLFGPVGEVLSTADVARMQLPAVVSLSWVMFGASLCCLGKRMLSRGWWRAGAALLVMAACKLVMFDFAGLGQLGNIFAFIIAGLMFLGVAWLAPQPPAPTSPDGNTPPSNEPPTPEETPSSPLAEASPSSVPPAAKITLTLDEEFFAEPAAKPLRQPQPGLRFNGIWLLLLAAASVISLLLFIGRNTYEYQQHSKAVAERVAAHQAQIQAELANEAKIATASVPPVSPATPAPQLTEYQIDRSQFPHQSSCQFENLNLPDQAVIYLAGGYRGRDLDFQIDASGHSAGQMDIVVNQPDKPVVLMLGAYEPTVWNIGWTPGTRIVAVVVSGYYRQHITGISKLTPLINSSYDNRGVCGYFYVSSDQSDSVNPAANANQVAMQLFKRPVDLLIPTRQGQALVGKTLATDDALQTSSDLPRPDSFRLRNTPLAGEAGLSEAVSQGILRPATRDDMLRLQQAKQRAQPLTEIPVASTIGSAPTNYPLFNSYVVLKPFAIPAGLYGAHRAVFLVEQGVPMPTGNPGHSEIHSLETGACSGGICRNR